MQSHAALLYFHISSPYRKWVSFLKFTVYIVKIDKKQNPLKSIAKNCSNLLQCIWIVCMTPELVCGGRGGQRYRNTLYTIFLTFICRLEMKKKSTNLGVIQISADAFFPLLDPPSSDRVWYFSQTPTPDSQPPQNFFKSQKSRLPPWKHFLNRKAYERKILNKKQITLNHFCLFFLPSNDTMY